MKEVKRFYMVETKYGINIIAEIHNGDYYQQIHSTLCHDGGGAATWVKLELVYGVPLIINGTETFVKS